VRAGGAKGGRSRRALGFLVVGLALAVLECGWLSWFLTEPLPNSAPVGRPKLHRSDLLWRALPGVVPGVRLEQSLLGPALRDLSHVENLPQRVPIVIAAGLIAVAALALGDLALRGLRLLRLLGPSERIALAFGLGTTGLGVVTLGLGRLGLLSPWPTRLGLGLLVLAEAALLVLDRWLNGGDEEARDTGGGGGAVANPKAKPLTRPSGTLSRGERGRGEGHLWLGFGLLAGPFLLIMALGAMLPATDFDSIEYHLQGPKEYFQAGRIAFLPHNVYTSMPFVVEMLHLLGIEVLGDWWLGALAGQLLVASYAPATAAMIALTARRWASPRAAWVAAIVYLSTPWVYRIAVIPYVEGPLCYYHAALVWAASRALTAEPGSRTKLWSVVGGLAGGAMACKYPALISAVFPFGALAAFEAVRRRSGRIALAFAVGWAVVMTPWLAKNVADTGNPVYPLAYRVFGGGHWDEAQDAKWSAAHGSAVQGWKPISFDALTGSVIDVAGRSDWQSPLYVALAPLAWLRRGSRGRAWALGGYVAYLFSTWWLVTHRLDRFWLPMLPALAVLAGLGADWVGGRAWSIALSLLLMVSVAANLVQASSGLTAFNEWTGDLRVLRRRIPEILNPPLARLDAESPPGARILLVGQAGVFHFEHPIVYNTVFDRETLELLARGRTPAQVRRALVDCGVTHVYVDWHEIERYRSPGNYGFTPFVTPDLFAGLVAAGIFEPPRSLGARQELYRVRPA